MDKGTIGPSRVTGNMFTTDDLKNELHVYVGAASGLVPAGDDQTRVGLSAAADESGDSTPVARPSQSLIFLRRVSALSEAKQEDRNGSVMSLAAPRTPFRSFIRSTPIECSKSSSEEESENDGFSMASTEVEPA
ncbi:unnamed protein product [Orchesella dallaii]|uniref:Uncharacterized protein n=1 Tax=Orchesella dallaii TaxID=48710 RepID=A0ABP1PJZ5_9HEXA